MQEVLAAYRTDAELLDLARARAGGRLTSLQSERLTKLAHQTLVKAFSEETAARVTDLAARGLWPARHTR